MQTLPRTLEHINPSTPHPGDHSFPGVVSNVSTHCCKTKQGHELCLSKLEQTEDSSRQVFKPSSNPTLPFSPIPILENIEEFENSRIEIFISFKDINYNFNMPSEYINDNKLPCILIDNKNLDNYNIKKIKFILKKDSEEFFVICSKIVSELYTILVPIGMINNIDIKNKNIRIFKHKVKKYLINNDKKQNNEKKQIKNKSLKAKYQISKFIFCYMPVLKFLNSDKKVDLSILNNNYKYPMYIYFEAIYLYLMNIDTSMREVAKTIRKKYGIDFSYSTLSRFLKRLHNKYNKNVLKTNSYIKKHINDYEGIINTDKDNFKHKMHKTKCKYYYLSYFISFEYYGPEKFSKYNYLYRLEVRRLNLKYLELFSRFLWPCNKAP